MVALLVRKAINVVCDGEKNKNNQYKVIDQESGSSSSSFFFFFVLGPLGILLHIYLDLTSRSIYLRDFVCFRPPIN
ncbi:hypothetical protein ACFXTO_031778 [Malus domestica]